MQVYMETQSGQLSCLDMFWMLPDERFDIRWFPSCNLQYGISQSDYRGWGRKSNDPYLGISMKAHRRGRYIKNLRHTYYSLCHLSALI